MSSPTHPSHSSSPFFLVIKLPAISPMQSHILSLTFRVGSERAQSKSVCYMFILASRESIDHILLGAELSVVKFLLNSRAQIVLIYKAKLGIESFV